MSENKCDGKCKSTDQVLNNVFNGDILQQLKILNDNIIKYVLPGLALMGARAAKDFARGESGAAAQQALRDIEELRKLVDGE